VRWMRRIASPENHRLNIAFLRAGIMRAAP
jgi:hypothetical protein